jgi:hypothetical protein
VKLRAVAAAPQEYTCERVPLAWAMSTGNQGVVLMLIAERLGDVTKARSAIQQIEMAFATMRDGGKPVPPGTMKRSYPRPDPFSIG